MKKKFFKRIVSLAIVAVMAVSTMVVSALSASAMEIPMTYRVFIKADFMKNTSDDVFDYTIIGEKGTKSFSYSFQGKKLDLVTVECFDLGELKSIEISGSSENSPLYLDYIEVSDCYGSSTKFNGGNCINGEKIVLSKVVEVEDFIYKLEFTTKNGEGISGDDISVMINGVKGSTEWYNIGKIGNAESNTVEITSKTNVGAVKGITLKNNGSDRWFPEKIKIEKIIGDKSEVTEICCGKWINEQETVTFKSEDRVINLIVKTSSNEFAGTKGNVFIKIYDSNDNATDEINLTELHSDPNGFESKVEESFAISVPANFENVETIQVRNDDSSDEWLLDYIDATLDDDTIRFNSYKAIGNEFTTLEKKPYTYVVTVKTSDVDEAGTDCDVYLRAYNAKHNLIKDYELETDGDSFEKNDTDVIQIESPERITDIEMETMRGFWNVTANKKWHCSYVQIDQYFNDKLVESKKYNFDKWIEPGMYAVNNIFQTIPEEHFYYKPESVEVLTVES